MFLPNSEVFDLALSHSHGSNAIVEVENDVFMNCGLMF
jgi:hypothetical protein